MRRLDNRKGVLHLISVNNCVYQNDKVALPTATLAADKLPSRLTVFPRTVECLFMQDTLPRIREVILMVQLS